MEVLQPSSTQLEPSAKPVKIGIKEGKDVVYKTAEEPIIDPNDQSIMMRTYDIRGRGGGNHDTKVSIEDGKIPSAPGNDTSGQALVSSEMMYVKQYDDSPKNRQMT